MANIIYKCALDGTQVNFETGNLTDISTFTGDVRAVAIQDSIADGVTTIGASQDAIYAMSGYLAANAHPVVSPASNVSEDHSGGTVLQDATFTFDSDGHVTAASFNEVDLDTIYYPKADVNSISGALIVDIGTNDTELGTLRTATGYLENQVDDLQAVSGSFQSLTLDNVCDNGATTNQDIQVEDLRVNGGNITGPSTITIDTDSSGPAGTVVIQGDLQVEGTTTTISSTDVQIGDINMILGTGAANDAAADGGGIIISGTAASTIAEFTYDSTNNRWKTNSIDIAADIVGNASTASAWVADSTITLDGDLAGAVTFNADSSETLTATIGAGVVENTMLENKSVSITGGAGLAGGGDAELGGSAVSLSIAAGDGLTAGTDALDLNLDVTTLSKGASGLKVNSIGTAQLDANSVTSAELHSSVAGENITFNGGELQVLDTDIRAAITGGASSIAGTNLGTSKALISNSSGKVAVSTVTSTELSQLAGIGGTTVSAQLALKADASTQMSASDGLTGGGTLAADRSFSTTADQGHLDEIELGTSNTLASNVITKGGILILRGTDNNGITTSGSDGNAVALNDKTTVAFEGVVQSTDTNQPDDNGAYVAMWKIQGVIRRDSDSTNMLQSFVTKTFAGSSASSYGLSVSVNGSGLKIASDQTTATLITSATINYNWVEETT